MATAPITDPSIHPSIDRVRVTRSMDVIDGMFNRTQFDIDRFLVRWRSTSIDVDDDVAAHDGVDGDDDDDDDVRDDDDDDDDDDDGGGGGARDGGARASRDDDDDDDDGREARAKPRARASPRFCHAVVRRERRHALERGRHDVRPGRAAAEDARARERARGGGEGAARAQGWGDLSRDAQKALGRERRVGWASGEAHAVEYLFEYHFGD